MSAKPPKKLPKLPYGQGSFSWANSEHTNIKFQRIFKNDINNKKIRLIVYGKTINECYENMKKKERFQKQQALVVLERNFFDKNVLLSSAMLSWLKTTKMDKNKANSYDRDECTILNQIEPYEIGLTPVIEVEKKDIERHLHFLQYEYNKGSGYSFSTLKKTYEILDQFFAYYFAKTPHKNPMIGIARPTRRKEVGEITLEDANTAEEIRDMVLSDEEIKIFKEACYEKPVAGKQGGTKYGVALYFIMLTFLRVGEATTLTWSDIDFDNRVLKITKSVSRVKDRSKNAETKTKIILTKPKTKNSMREVALTDEALEALNYIRERSNFTEENNYVICTNKGTRVLEQNLLSGLKGKLRSCGLNKNGKRDKFGIHYLRHTGISYYLRHGVPVDVISQMAGHASTAITTQTYYHVIKSQKEEALKKMNAINI